ncbi:MAG: tyrosine-type recombinase/integrase, partial [Pseudomonadota bacterium]
MSRHVEAFLEMMAVERGAATNTLDAYRRDLLDLAGHLRGRAVVAASEDDLRGYLRSLAGMATRTQARRLSCLRQFYAFAYAEGWRPDDPTSRLDAPRLGRVLPKLLSEAEVDALLAAGRALPGADGVMMTALLELLYGTGLRVSELVGLPFAAVARDPAMLVVRGKGSKERMVPLSDPARDALKDWKAARDARLGRKPSKWLFPSHGRSGHLTRSGFARMLLRVGMVAGIDPRRLSPHVLR